MTYRHISTLDEVASLRALMAGGGDAPSVSTWDLSVLTGCILMLSTVFIAVWTLPEISTIELDGAEEHLIIHTGVSDATVSFDVGKDESCMVSNGTECDGFEIIIIESEGGDWDGVIPSNAMRVDVLDGKDKETVRFSDPLSQGEYRVVFDGEGEYFFEADVNRSVPHEYIPAVFGAFLIVWGIWRGRQEPVE